MQVIGDIWNLIFFQPMLNALLMLYALLFSNFGIAIIVFTLVIRLIMLPLTLKQLRSAKQMSSLQPKLKELQNKYGKDRERLSQETMALYKEHGVNPVGCAVPTLLQFPIWIGLYQSIQLAMAVKPTDLIRLSDHLYKNLDLVHQIVPVHSQFLWLNLATPDPFYLLPILVGVTMWVQQSMATLPSADAQQAQMNNLLRWLMPAFFAFMTISFPSGLGIYWVTSNLISIALQYKMTGWGQLAKYFGGEGGPGLRGVLSRPVAPQPNSGISALPARGTKKPNESSKKSKAPVKPADAPLDEAVALVDQAANGVEALPGTDVVAEPTNGSHATSANRTNGSSDKPTPSRGQRPPSGRPRRRKR